VLPIGRSPGFNQDGDVAVIWLMGWRRHHQAGNLPNVIRIPIATHQVIIPLFLMHQSSFSTFRDPVAVVSRHGELIV
jgi:hypothetical protein